MIYLCRTSCPQIMKGQLRDTDRLIEFEGVEEVFIRRLLPPLSKLSAGVSVVPLQGRAGSVGRGKNMGSQSNARVYSR